MNHISLKGNRLSAGQVASELGITRESVRYHIGVGTITAEEIKHKQSPTGKIWAIHRDELPVLASALKANGKSTKHKGFHANRLTLSEELRECSKTLNRLSKKVAFLG
jgi:hypothetical protein